MSDIKKELRENMLQLRGALPKSYREFASQVIADDFFYKWGDYDIYALYSPIGSEVDTARLTQLLAGKDMLYPKVKGDELLWGKGMLTEGYGGIKEPAILVDYLPQIVAVPCLAFDRNNYRLGYGKGFYDRFLAKFPEIFSVALAFAYQEVDTVFPEKNDVRVKAVLTDKKVLAAGR
ncbi:MAG: 5-formyltetrahydrofolate cyclo-ligase [Deferribacteraceae bacterium]|jgi:5-formyltetrahydrofolate cyclo-ligase|nr:5-formyltetrahydrofolate cyclo-ligase [Deferribacteraceae bacterium]